MSGEPTVPPASNVTMQQEATAGASRSAPAFSKTSLSFVESASSLGSGTTLL
jgi:hypothetical protein